MKTEKKFFAIFISLVIAIFIYSDSASASVQIIIKLPKNFRDSSSSASLETTSSASIPSGFYKSTNIEITNFLVDDNISLGIKNYEEEKRVLLIKVILIDKESGGETISFEYKNIKLNAMKKIKITLKDKKIKNLKNGTVIVEIIENGLPLISVGSNKFSKQSGYLFENSLFIL